MLKLKHPLISWLVVLIGLLFAVYHTYGPSNNGGTTTSSVLVFVAVGWFLAPLAVLMFISVRRTVKSTVESMFVASKPIPSPAQISALLEQEWGRPATVQEVAAVHQMLTSQKNQAMLNAGIGLGALYLLGHKGKL